MQKQPYVCVACEKVILSKDNVASLIGLFSKIVFTVPAGIEIPKNAVSPKEWAVFSIWDPDPGDENRHYVLRTQILYPDKSQFGEILKSKIPIEPNAHAQMIMQFVGFPVGQIGDYTVRTWIEENETRVVGPIEFKLGVEAKPAPST